LLTLVASTAFSCNNLINRIHISVLPPITNIYTLLLHKGPDMHCVKHKLVKNTLPSHHVKHDDARLPSNCRRAEKQVVSRHPGWLDLSLKPVLSVEFVELSQ
jgi:hypothetical protein